MESINDVHSEHYEHDLNKSTTSAKGITEHNSKIKIAWINVIGMFFLHVGAIYGFYLYLTQAMWATLLFMKFLFPLNAFGITAGAHRLWAHKSYKAKLPLRILLVILNTLAMQNSILIWVRDHRMHHKHSETDADPHNIKRGFFFAHMGWLMVRKHQEIKDKSHTVDMTDLWADPLLRFQYKYYYFLFPIIGFALPAFIPTLWGENVVHAFMVCGTLRYVITLHGTWLVNSAAHIWGEKPYDKNIHSAENLKVSGITFGEGFHNYHHTFPWDYKAAELGNYNLNLTTFFIDKMASIGWAYDLKSATPILVESRVKRTGDNSHYMWGHNTQEHEHIQ